MKLNFGIKPFWFWNGDMEDDEITRQIKEMGQKGISGFFIHPRQGLKIPYLSEQWFGKVGVALEGAKKYGLEMWLYDEYPYPSGISGGEVVCGHPEYEAKVLKVKKADVTAGQTVDIDLTWGEVILAAAYPVLGSRVLWEKAVDLSKYIGIVHQERIFQKTGLTNYNNKRFFTGNAAKSLHWTAEEGQWKIYVFSQVPVRHFKYYDTFIDLLNPGAIARFIQTTHERYKEHFGCEFGKTIKGVFSDEVAPFGGDMPWSPLLPGMFLERNGYTLTDKLPGLLEPMDWHTGGNTCANTCTNTCGETGGSTDKLRYDYWNTVVNAFIESFDMQIHNWCLQNNLLYAGEKPILRSSQLQHMDIPGIDAGHQKAGDKPIVISSGYRANAKAASSAAHFYKKESVLCESFHSIGWSMTLQDMKWMYDWLSIQGINMFVPHAFYYTTDSLAKHDAPPSSFFQMPYWKHSGLLSDYLKDLLNSVSAGSRKVNILVIDPVTSTWTAMGEKKLLKKKIAMDFAKLQEVLVSNHLDYYIVDPQLLAQAQVQDRHLYINGEAFDVLLLPPMLNIESEALAVIEKYLENGGTLIATGCLPIEKIDGGNAQESLFDSFFSINSRELYDSYTGNSSESNSSKINSPESCSKDAMLHGLRTKHKDNQVFTGSIHDVPKLINKFLQKDIYVLTHPVTDPVTENEENGHILAAHYTNGEENIYFLANTSANSYDTQIKLKLEGVQSPELKIRQMGSSGKEDLDIPNHMEGGYLIASLHFYPYQSYVLTLNSAPERVNGESQQKPLEEPKQESKQKLPLDLEGQWDLFIKGMNALRLDDWLLEVKNTEDWAYPFVEAAEKTVNSMPLIDQIADSRISLPIKLTEYFGCPKGMQFPPLNCKYQTKFNIDLPGRLWLVIEPGSISGEWSIQLNEHEITPESLVQKEFYLPSNLAVDISSMVHQGENTLRVLVKTLHTFDGVVNPLYLLGSFGAFRGKCSTWTITSLPETGEIGNRAGCGLPFYAGEIQYSRDWNPKGIGKSDKFDLYLENPLIQNAVSLYVNGHPAGVKAWSPYVWEVDGAWLREDGNTIMLEMTTELLGLFEGQTFDPVERTIKDL